MDFTPENHRAIASALAWVSRIITVVVMMAVPALAGWKLDDWLGTNFLVLVGGVFGLAAGFWLLLRMTRSIPTYKPRSSETDKEKKKSS